MKNEIKHTAHSSYRCEYHIVFAPKYRRKEIYGKLRKDIVEILKKLCEEKRVEIIEGTACVDHIHMLVSIPPYLSVAQFVGFLKSKSALMIFDRHANLKYKYGNRNFWCRGYYVDTVGKNERVIREYIRNQLEEDFAKDQVSIKEYMDRHVGIFCVSVFRQNQEYHVINVHDGAYFPCLRLFWKVETVCAPVRRECRHSLPETLLQGNQPV